LLSGDTPLQLQEQYTFHLSSSGGLYAPSEATISSDLLAANLPVYGLVVNGNGGLFSKSTQFDVTFNYSGDYDTVSSLSDQINAALNYSVAASLTVTGADQGKTGINLGQTNNPLTGVSSNPFVKYGLIAAVAVIAGLFVFGFAKGAGASAGASV
jgi:hypothetical protein